MDTHVLNILNTYDIISSYSFIPEEAYPQGLDYTGFDHWTESLGDWMGTNSIDMSVGVFPYTDGKSYHQSCIILQRKGYPITLFNRGFPCSTKEQVIRWGRETVDRWRQDMDWVMSLGYDIVDLAPTTMIDAVLSRRLSYGRLYMRINNSRVDMTLLDQERRFIPMSVTSDRYRLSEFSFDELRRGVIEYEKELYTVDESRYMLSSLKRLIVEGVE